MKNKKLIKIFAAIISCLLLVGAVVGITVFAEQTAPEIKAKNLAYEGAVQIVYYVNTNDVAAGYTVKLATWTKADKSDLVEKEAEDFTKFIGDVEYSIFTSEGIEPKKMRDTVYAQTVLYNGEAEVDRGEVTEYSVYTYVNNRLNKDATASQRALYHALVNYGASVQKVLGYNQYKLANDMFLDYDTIVDTNNTHKLDELVPTGSTLTRTLYKATDGTWSVATSEGATEYVFTYLYSGDNIVNPDGTFTYQRITTILSITEAGAPIDSVDVGGTVLSVGGVMPRTIAGAAVDYLADFEAGIYPDIKKKTGSTVAVFDTQMSLNYRATVAYAIGILRTYSLFNTDNSFQVQDNWGSLKVAGVDCSAFASSSSFNLRVVFSENGNGGYTYSIYVNNTLVKENVAITLPANILETSKVVDRLSLSAVGSDTRNAKVVLSDTTFVRYEVADIEGVEGANKVNLSAANKTDTVKNGTVSVTASGITYTVAYQATFTSSYDAAAGTYTFGDKVVITSIKNGDVDVPSFVESGVTYTVGSVVPKKWVGWIADYDCYTLAAPVTASKSVDGLLFQFRTEMVVLGEHEAPDAQENHIRFAVKIGSDKLNKLFIANKGGKVYMGTSSASINTGIKAGTAFDFVVRGYAAASGYELKVYANGYYVTSFTTTAIPENFGFSVYSNTKDVRVVLMDTYCDSYWTPVEPAGVNKVDFNDEAVTKKDQVLTTTYVKVSGDTMTTSDSSDFTHLVVWESTAPATVSADGSAYTFGKSKKIVSVTANGSTEETSFTAGGFTYVKGAVIGSSGWSGSGSTIYFATDSTKSGATALTGNTPLTAPTGDEQLRFVWDTDIVVAPGTRTDTQQIKYMLESGSNQEITQNYYFFQRVGTSVKVMFGGSAYTVAQTGEKFNLRIEVREIETDLTEDPNKAGTTYRPIELKLYINGTLKATYTDQCDAGSGNYDNMPSRVSLNTLSSSCDMYITFTDMYVDRYTAAE